MNKLDQILMDAGYPENLSGTHYLRVAIQKYRRGMLITGELYPEVAKEVGSTASRVERAIRHATETACDRLGYYGLANLYGNTIDPERGRPTNSEAIARLAKLLHDN